MVLGCILRVQFSQNLQVSLENEAPILQALASEIEEQSLLQAGRLQIVNDLSFFKLSQFGLCLYFQYYAVEAHEISSIDRSPTFAFVANGKGNLTFELHVLHTEFPGQCFMVHSL